MSTMQMFLKVALIAAAVASSASAESIPPRVDAYAGSWAVENKHDPISGKPWIIAEVKSDTDHMWMQARCEGIPIIVFGVGGDGINFRLNEIVKARVRIDDNAPHEMKAVLVDVATGAASTLLTRKFYAEMLDAKTMGVQLERPDGQQWSFMLHLSKTKQALQSMLKACPLESALDAL
jgi:hypothetical protein